MYQSALPEAERLKQGAWMRTQGLADSNQRRELNLGFAALRRAEALALCQHHGLPCHEGMIGDTLKALLDNAWAAGQLKLKVEEAIPRKPTLIELRNRASRVGINIDGYDAEMAETMVVEAERARASQDRVGSALGNAGDDLGASKGSGKNAGKKEAA